MAGCAPNRSGLCQPCAACKDGQHNMGCEDDDPGVCEPGAEPWSAVDIAATVLLAVVVATSIPLARSLRNKGGLNFRLRASQAPAAQEPPPDVAQPGSPGDVVAERQSFRLARIDGARGEELTRWIQGLFLASACADAQCQRICQSVVAVAVHRVENRSLRDRYTTTRGRLQQRAPEPIAVDAYISLLDSASNEVYLWHGCQSSSAMSIARRGFKDQFADVKGLYGIGTYLTPQACKALQYCRAQGCGIRRKRCGSLLCRCEDGPEKTIGHRHLLLCRALLGDAYYATGPMVGASAPPTRSAERGGRHDSVLITPGIPNGRKWPQQHREVVISQRHGTVQIYPEYIVEIAVT